MNRPPLFKATSGRYAANPDIVIRDAKTTVAIADAKYKDLSGWPSTSDIFELLCHASTYKARKGFIIFPSEVGFAKRYFGWATTECEVWVFGVTFDHFETDLRSALVITGLLPATDIGVAP